MRAIPALVSSLPLCVMVRIVAAQAASPDSARCAAALNAPTKDSAIVQVQAIFTPFDTMRKVPDSYREFLGEGLREMLVLPSPLSVNAYDSNVGGLLVEGAKRGEYAMATLRSFYRFTLHRDGRLTNVRVVGGVRDAVFDAAVLHALVALDSTQMLPIPNGFDEAFDHDALAMRLTITGGTVVSTKSNRPFPSPTGGVVTPLVQLRVPLLRVDREAGGVPGNPFVRPLVLKHSIEGSVELEFLVRSDGTADLQSVQVWKTTSIDVLEAVLEFMPNMRFYPMRIGGCDVASLVHTSFSFGLNR